MSATSESARALIKALLEKSGDLTFRYGALHAGFKAERLSNKNALGALKALVKESWIAATEEVIVPRPDTEYRCIWTEPLDAERFFKLCMGDTHKADDVFGGAVKEEPHDYSFLRALAWVAHREHDRSALDALLEFVGADSVAFLVPALREQLADGVSSEALFGDESYAKDFVAMGGLEEVMDGAPFAPVRDAVINHPSYFEVDAHQCSEFFVEGNRTHLQSLVIFIMDALAECNLPSELRSLLASLYHTAEELKVGTGRPLLANLFFVRKVCPSLINLSVPSASLRPLVLASNMIKALATHSPLTGPLAELEPLIKEVVPHFEAVLDHLAQIPKPLPRSPPEIEGDPEIAAKLQSAFHQHAASMLALLKSKGDGWDKLKDEGEWATATRMCHRQQGVPTAESSSKGHGKKKPRKPIFGKKK